VRKLTPKQQIFVSEYLIDLNATQAAIRAGYSQKTSSWIGPQLLAKSHVSQAIADKMERRSVTVGVDANYVLKRLTEIDEMDVIDILDSRGSFKPIADWPKIWRQFISGIDVAEMWEGQGDDRKLAGLLKKIKWPDKIKNLELIGKHVAVQAFKDQVAHSGAIEITESIKDVLSRVEDQTWGLPNG
jgi:phage terminase small subunit